MREDVHDVLALRAPDPRGLSRMISWSLTVHLAAVILFALAPKLGWIRSKPPEKVMVITLGGSVGPRESGSTTIGGRPVDQVAPEPKRPEVAKPVATKPDTMVVPSKPAPPPKTPPKTEQAKAPSLVTQPLLTGRQVTPGNSRAETGVRGIGTGLQIGGGGLGGETTLSEFCCMAYLREVQRRIEAKWDPQQAERGLVIVQFTIQRNGQVTDLAVVRGGSFLLERASRVPFMGLQLPALPPEYAPPTITLRLTFEYR